jgi:hypothetical protein
MAAVRGATTVLAALLGVRALALFVQLQLQRGGVQRFHVETAFVWFALLGIISLAVRGETKGRDDDASSDRPISLAWLPVLWALAVALYLPALSVGFLSDDFPLLERAAHWQLGAVHAALFRPLPMLVWSILEAAAAPAAVYHLLNVLLHGTNAFLSGLIIRGWIRRRGAGESGALLVLLTPLAVEAVAWCSGLFDVSMTTFALATLLIFRAREKRRSPALLAAGIATAGAAILCKETGVVIPALLVCDAVARRSRAYLRDAGLRIVSVVAVAYAAVRIWLAFGATAAPLTKYVVQRTLFQAFGALADPWRADVTDTAPVLAVLYVGIVACLLVRFVVVARSRESLRVPFAACLWILASVAPVGTILWIPGDLQASRYMYLAAGAWAGLLCAAAWESTNGTGRARPVVVPAFLALLVLATYSTRQNLGPWTEAAGVRDRVIAAAQRDPAIQRCDSIAVAGVPDAVRGAYVFRNGVAEAFSSEIGITVGPAIPSGCSFRWDPAGGLFASPSAGR